MDRLMTCKVPITDPTMLNLLNLASNPNKATEKDPVFTAAMMEKLKKAGEAQTELVENLLRTEIFKICKSLYANQYSLYHDKKSHVTSQFKLISKPSFHVTKNGIVIEILMLLYKKRVPWVKSFEDYMRFLYHVIMKSVEPYSRCDIVTDRYFSESLKEGVWDNKGSDGLSINDSIPFSENFESYFLANVTNKANRSQYLVQKFLNPLSTNFTKWSNTRKQFVSKLSTNCFSVFYHFVGLALKGLSFMIMIIRQFVLHIMTESLQMTTMF